MKYVQTEPIVEQLIVIIEELKYKGLIHTIEVTCNLAGQAITAETEQHSKFIMGSTFWDKNFGKRQANRIRKICKEQVAAFKKKEGLVC